jgi:hypothetical protein
LSETVFLLAGFRDELLAIIVDLMCWDGVGREANGIGRGRRGGEVEMLGSELSLLALKCHSTLHTVCSPRQ